MSPLTDKYLWQTMEDMKKEMLATIPASSIPVERIGVQFRRRTSSNRRVGPRSVLTIFHHHMQHLLGVAFFFFFGKGEGGVNGESGMK